MHPLRSSVPTAVVVLLMVGCAGPQSALDPAGTGAERIASLWWTMAIIGGLIWAIIVSLTLYAIRAAPERTHPRRDARRFILGGTAATIAILTVLLIVGLRLMPELLATPDDALHVEVSGEEFWWRFVYAADTIETANELRLPAGRAAVLHLETADVIHSFWVPSLAGKVDLLPGRTTRLVLEPTRPGRYRGTCAEFCGLSHAFMGFTVVVVDSAAFAAWLERQAAPASAPADERSARGREAFLEHGCGACHTIRGTEAAGRLGPDLTHVGSRDRIGAGRLPNDADGFARWIGNAPGLKPGAHMPAFGMLPDDDLRALASYLDGLE